MVVIGECSLLCASVLLKCGHQFNTLAMDKHARRAMFGDLEWPSTVFLRFILSSGSPRELSLDLLSCRRRWLPRATEARPWAWASSRPPTSVARTPTDRPAGRCMPSYDCERSIRYSKMIGSCEVDEEPSELEMGELNQLNLSFSILFVHVLEYWHVRTLNIIIIIVVIMYL